MLNTIEKPKKAKGGPGSRQQEPTQQDELSSDSSPLAPPEAGTAMATSGPVSEQQLDLTTELLGTDTANLSREDLAGLAQTLPLKEAQDMGLERSDVVAAVQELKDLAVEEGRDPAGVDSAVALEALVGQQELLQEMERQGLDVNLEATLEQNRDKEEALSPSMSLQSAEERSQTQEMEAEREMEMEMDMGGGD